MDPSDWRLSVIVNHLTDFWTFFFCFVSLCDSQLLFFSLLCVCPSSSSSSSLCLSCCPSSPLQTPLPLHVRPFWPMVVVLETLRLNPHLVLTEGVALVIQASFFSCFLSAPTCFYCICFLWSFTNLFVDLFILATGILSVPFGRTSYFFCMITLVKARYRAAVMQISAAAADLNLPSCLMKSPEGSLALCACQLKHNSFVGLILP